MTSPIGITLLEKYIREPSKSSDNSEDSFNPLHVPFVIRGDDNEFDVEVDSDLGEQDQSETVESKFEVSHIEDGLFKENIGLEDVSNDENCSHNPDSRYSSCLDSVDNDDDNKCSGNESKVMENAIDAIFGE